MVRAMINRRIKFMKKITKLFLTSVVLLMMITGFATITSAETLNKGTPLTNENTKEKSQLQGLPTKLYKGSFQNI